MYIREAHSLDGEAPIVGAHSPLVEQPLHLGERRQVAQACSSDLDLGIPVLVDDVDDAAARAYGGWPDRLVVVVPDGRVVFQSAPGPRGFDVEELAAALERLLLPEERTPESGGS